MSNTNNNNDGRNSKAPRLSRDESELLAQRIGDLSVSSLPLAEGLRVAADESDGRALPVALRDLASRIESGISLEEALTDRQNQMPSHIRGLMAASARSGQLGQTLSQLIEHQRSIRQMRQDVFSALAYPGLLLAMTLGVFAVFMFLVVPTFKAIFDDFGLKLPTSTTILFWLSDTGIWLLVGLLVVLPILAFVARLVLGPSRWKRLMITLPVFGPLWHWMGVAQMSRLLSVLLEQRLPLPEALRLTGEGTSDANLREVCCTLAEGTEQGRSLSEMVSAGDRLPLAMVPLIRWGERSDTLAEAMLRLSEMFETRIQARASLLKAVSPPLVFVFVALTTIFTLIFALFGPMAGLMTGLS